MERFITYMYAYENRIKGRNVGFVKVECRKDTCALEIHIRNLGRFSGKCHTYLLMDENVIGVELGTMIISYGQGQAIYYFDRNDIEQSGYRLEQVKAVRVECGSQEFLASCWSEEAGNWIAQDISAFMKSENMQADKVADQTQNSNGHTGILQTEPVKPNMAQHNMSHNSVYNPARANQQESNAQFTPGYYNSEGGNLSQLENTASQFPQSQIEGAFGYWLSQAL